MEVASIREPLPVRNNYIKIVRLEPGFYCQTNHVKNKCIWLLYHAFTDHDINAKWMLDTLTDFSSKGVVVELVDIDIEANKVIMQPTSILCEDPENFAVEFDRNEIMRLTYAWYTLTINKASSIYIYYKDEKYGVSDILPDGVD